VSFDVHHKQEHPLENIFHGASFHKVCLLSCISLIEDFDSIEYYSISTIELTRKAVNLCSQSLLTGGYTCLPASEWKRYEFARAAAATKNRTKCARPSVTVIAQIHRKERQRVVDAVADDSAADGRALR
jgi:hypothetical protein